MSEQQKWSAGLAAALLLAARRRHLAVTLVACVAIYKLAMLEKDQTVSAVITAAREVIEEAGTRYRDHMAGSHWPDGPTN